MSAREYEGTLNVWLAGHLRKRGLSAREERAQGGGRRIDVEIRIGPVKIALEAEQGQTPNKKAEAIRDADKRLRQRLADCAIALCYAEGVTESELPDSRMLWTIRTPSTDRQIANANWEEANLDELVSIIRLAPAQLGNPDHTAAALSVSLDEAVGRLSETQKYDLAGALDLPAGKATKMGQRHSSRYNQAAKRAMLVIATAVMFHTQLDKHRRELKPELDNREAKPPPFTGEWPPSTALDCVHSTDPIGAFYEAWDLWLAVDYKPIFATARNALRGCPQDSAFAAAVKGTARAATTITRNIVGLRHDMLGRIFHTVLDTARYDGSFYTTTAAATLLAALAICEDFCDWSDAEAIARLRITDPACGTGTLLMAAAERIRDLTSGARDDETISRALIESVLTGYDVNLTATHMAATTLGLLSPTTSFREMKIGRALLGVEEGKAFLGSLEFLSRESFPQMMPWPTGVEQIETEQEIARAEPADLVIMNPPFTRDSLRHDQFSREEELTLKERERYLFSRVESGAVHRSHNGGGFLLLAEFLARTKKSTVAAVLPTVGATNYSTMKLRRFLARKFHIETIVTSHDPQRIYFSENTNIGEMLLICRRWPAGKKKPPTQTINLHVNPATPAAAIGVAQAIRQGKTESIRGTVQKWPASRIAEGNWGAVQFLSPYLCEKFIDLKDRKFFKTVPLRFIAEISPDGRGIRDAFKKSELSDREARVALWDHKTDVTQKMSASHDTYIVAKDGKSTQADNMWSKRGMLLLAMRARLNTVRTVSVRLSQRALGSMWVPCKPNVQDENVEKAICVYLNSTIGILAMLGDRTNKIPSYPQFSMDDLRRIPVPDFATMDEAQVGELAAAYDEHCDSVLLPLPRMNECETRAALDAAVIAALGIDAEIVATIRRELTREPSITGKRYA